MLREGVGTPLDETFDPHEPVSAEVQRIVGSLVDDAPGTFRTVDGVLTD